LSAFEYLEMVVIKAHDPVLTKNDMKQSGEKGDCRLLDGCDKFFSSAPRLRPRFNKFQHLVPNQAK
jgi:hypothetical protein